MRTLQPRPQRWPRVVLLAVLCAVLGIAQCMAQPAPAAANPQAPADFLATLSANAASGQSNSGAAGLLPPAPEFLQSSTGCTSDYQCLPDKLCCRDCGFFGCTHKACLTPMNGHCPAIP